jgi:predicted unusual protein kinase regulating ubiquinone biosynthesis (AarF/ABC1/UbiB family)
LIEQNLIQENSIEYLASGSIGTVFKGCLKNGKEVVIKIRHSDVEKDFQTWCALLSLFYVFIRPFIQCEAADVMEMLQSQFDFRIEATNLELFSKFYKKDDSVLKIPQVYYCSENILVTEYIPSYSNNEDLPMAFPEKVEKLCLLKCWIMDQIILKHCVHGDLHNGNWGITLDKQSIVLYDLGYMFNIPDLSTDFMIALLKKDSTDVSEKILELFNIPKEENNRESIQKLLLDYQKNKKFSFDFLVDLLQILYREKLVLFNKKVAFLLNLVMCLNHIHQVEFLQNAQDSMEYNYLTLQRFQVLGEYREYIVYDLFLK